jgi:PEP-CTERM motif
MRLRPLVASWMFVLATIVGLPKTLAALPISPTTSITFGDKLFDNFVFQLVATGCCRPPFGPSDISVTPLIDGDGNVGLRFEGPFSYTAPAEGGAAWSFFILFDVATLDSSQRIAGSRLAFDAVTTAGGFADVSSLFTISSGEFVEDLFVLEAESFTQLEDSVQLAVPLDRLRSTNLFSAAGTGTVDFTRVDQTFTQTSVPEPSVFVLLGLGLVTVVTVRKCVSVKARSVSRGCCSHDAPTAQCGCPSQRPRH